MNGGGAMVSTGFVSGDAHVNEPRNLWRDNLPRSLRGHAMVGIRPGQAGGWEVLTNVDHAVRPDEAEEDRLRVNDPEHRARIMGEEGIVAECIYPTIGLYAWMVEDAAAGAASCRVYNEWIADGLGRSPRFACAGLVPTWEVGKACAEVEWIAEAGLRAAMLPAVAPQPWNDPIWDPLWSCIEESGLPVVMHQGTGHSMHFYRGRGAGVANLLATQSMAPRVATLLATSGVLADHPELHVVFVEYNGGWLGWVMHTIDSYDAAFRAYGTTPAGKRWVDPELPDPPSTYLRRQVHATFQDDPIAITNIRHTGVRSLIWGSDYPHEEGTYPRSRATVSRLATELDSDDAARIFRANAAELFGFTDDVLEAPR